MSHFKTWPLVVLTTGPVLVSMIQTAITPKSQNLNLAQLNVVLRTHRCR